MDIFFFVLGMVAGVILVGFITKRGIRKASCKGTLYSDGFGNMYRVKYVGKWTFNGLEIKEHE